MTNDLSNLCDLRARITLASDGTWYSDGERVEHRRLAALFYRSVIFDEGLRSYVLKIGEQVASINVEDSAFFVDGWRVEASRLKAILCGGTCVPLDIPEVRIATRGYPYCLIWSGHRARLLRSAYQQLVSTFRDDATVLYEGVPITLAEDSK